MRYNPRDLDNAARRTAFSEAGSSIMRAFDAGWGGVVTETIGPARGQRGRFES